MSAMILVFYPREDKVFQIPASLPSPAKGYRNEIFLCPICGDIWAKVIYFPLYLYAARMVKCKTHFGGAVSLECDLFSLSSSPMEFLHHELLTLAGARN